MNKGIHCCIDVGGTKIMLLLIGGDREVLYRNMIPTPIQKTPEVMVKTLHDLIHTALADTGWELKSLTGIGVCIAALINFEKGEIFKAANLGWHEPVSFRELMSKNWPCPVYVDNDTNAAVLGEVRYGAARGHQDVIYVTISTGIGSGLYLDGRVYRGGVGFAGEFGHIKAFGKGRECTCGGMDCLETWASGEAISHSARLLWEGGAEEKECVTTAWVFEQAQNRNVLAQRIIDQALDAIGMGLANLLALLNPTCLVIGGGVVRNKAEVLDRIRMEVFRHAISPAIINTPLEIVAAQLEPESGVWGMYSLMAEVNLA